MKLKNILTDTSWDKVKTQLLFYCDNDTLPLFENIYNELLTTSVTITNESPISIKIDFIKEEEFYDTHGIKENDNHIYSLSLSLWSEWLGYHIENETLQNFKKEEIIAHCLWEMTYYGITEDEVIKRRDELLESTKKIEERKYIEEKMECPFCKGSKINEENETCNLCNEDGYIGVVTIINE